MSWIYIVTWVVATMTLTVDYEKSIDEYGLERTSEPMYIWKETETESHRKEFKSREEAIRFIKNAPTQTKDYMGLGTSYCRDLKLDSVFVDD